MLEGCVSGLSRLAKSVLNTEVEEKSVCVVLSSKRSKGRARTQFEEVNDGWRKNGSTAFFSWPSPARIGPTAPLIAHWPRPPRADRPWLAIASRACLRDSAAIDALERV